jgi:hypothetical protein
MTKKDMTEEEALAAKYRQFDENGIRTYDGPTLAEHKAMLGLLKSGKIKIEAPNGEIVKIGKKETE